MGVNSMVLREGAESFWEMAALALAGRLASCQSCVEFFYFQSRQNATAFLDSCAAAGLVEKVSLLDLKSDIGGDESPTLRGWYDQAIYISAPAFRKLNPDAAKKRIESTIDAVYKAFHLYRELGSDDQAIDAAYLRAMTGKKLRNPELANQRRVVDLSAIAKLRLILDGFRNSIKKEAQVPPSDIERCATEATIQYVLASSGARPVGVKVHDYGNELDAFIFSFIGNPYKIKQYWQEHEHDVELPDGYHLRLLSVISELVCRRLEGKGRKARREFLERFHTSLSEARNNLASDTDYVDALSDSAIDVEEYSCNGHSVLPQLVADSVRLGASAAVTE
jgi:hypothetical protein